MTVFKCNIICFIIGFYLIEIYPQQTFIETNLELNISNEVYQEYRGLNLKAYFPIVENLSIGPYVKIFRTDIPAENGAPKRFIARAFVFGLKSIYFLLGHQTKNDDPYNLYTGLGLGYQMNKLGSSSNYNLNETENILVDDLNNDLAVDIFAGISLFDPKFRFIQLVLEIIYQIRNPDLLYTIHNYNDGIVNYEKKLGLNAFFGTIGLRILL